MTIVLASTSASRRTMLAAAGIPFTADAPLIDENPVKEAMLANASAPRDIADALAELKAVKVSRRHTGMLVLGSDSVVVLDDGTILDKPGNKGEAAQHLKRLSGTVHRLISAAVIALDGAPVWRHVDTAKMTVRSLSDGFIADYVEAEWPAIAHCVGCYRLEGPGVQLFSRIEGDCFTIRGLPLLAVLDYLRIRGVLAS